MGAQANLRGEGTGMPRPRLVDMVRNMTPLGMLSLVGCLSAAALAEDAILTDQAVPPQFQRTKSDVPEDPFPYHGLTVVHGGSSSSVLRKGAIAETPLQRLAPPEREQAESVLKGTSLYRRLPTISFEVDPAVYAYFLKNPDVAVSSWRAMGISKFLLEETKPNVYVADAGDGSRGSVHVFYSTPEDTLIYCEGAFKSPLLPKPIVARSLMRLVAKFDKQEDGRVVATHFGDVFVEFPSQTVETVARLISPVSHSIADRNFKQLTFYAHMMTVAMARQPGWVEAVARRMEGISDERREEFLRVSATSYVAARQREAAQLGQTISLEDLLRPLRLTPTASPVPSAEPAPPRLTAQPRRTTTTK